MTRGFPSGFKHIVSNVKNIMTLSGMESKNQKHTNSFSMIYRKKLVLKDHTLITEVPLDLF